MAVTHQAIIRQSLAQVILDAIDQDVGAGSLIFRTAADAEVATLTLSDPAGTLGGGDNAVLTFNPITSDTNATGGITTKFVITDNSGDEIVYGNVSATGGGGDIELSSTTIGVGDTVAVSSLTYTSAV